MSASQNQNGTNPSNSSDDSDYEGDEEVYDFDHPDVQRQLKRGYPNPRHPHEDPDDDDYSDVSSYEDPEDSQPAIALHEGECISENYSDNTFRAITLHRMEDLGMWRPEINLKNPDFKINLDICFNTLNNKKPYAARLQGNTLFFRVSPVKVIGEAKIFVKVYCQ